MSLARISSNVRDFPEFLVSSTWASITRSTALPLPLASAYVPAAFEGHLTSSEFKKYRRNADEWARSQTLLKSGVTARPEEVEAAFTNYWPQPGDGPTEVRDKRLARERAMDEAEAAYVRRTNPNAATSGATSDNPSLEELLEIYK